MKYDDVKEVAIRGRFFEVRGTLCGPCRLLSSDPLFKIEYSVADPLAEIKEDVFLVVSDVQCVLWALYLLPSRAEE